MLNQAAFVSVFLVMASSALPGVVKIAALLEEDKTASQELAFLHSIDMVNNDRSLLHGSRLSDKLERLTPGDSFKASKKVCELVQPGVTAIMGPQDPIIAQHVQSIAHKLKVPHIETRWDYSYRRAPFTLNIQPHPHMVSKAFAQFVESVQWKEMFILYEKEEGLVRLQELMRLPQTFEDVNIQIKKLNPAVDGDYSPDYRPILKEVKEARVKNLVIDIDYDSIINFMDQAYDVDMVTDYHNYLFTSLDLDKLNLDRGNWSNHEHSKNVNITGYRLVDPKSSQALLYKKKFPNVGSGKNHIFYSNNALMYDSVQVLANAMENLNSLKTINVSTLSCDNPTRPWPHGENVLGFLQDVNHDGLTGEVKFDSKGFRTDFSLDIMYRDSEKSKMIKVGTWRPEGGVNYTLEESEKKSSMLTKIHNKTFRVAITVGKSFAGVPPYVMEKTDVIGKDLETKKNMLFLQRYEGFCVDIIKELETLIKFKVKWQHDAYPYGSEDPAGSGKWNGLIGEVRQHRADMAIIDLSITSARQMAADFTMPFMTTGVGILYYKKEPPPPNLWSFLKPFAPEVWLYMTTIYFVASLLMFLLARLSPYEWDNPHPCVDEPEELENELTLHNCFWHNWGCLMQQGSDIAPKSVSCRIIAVSWWGFTLIIISSYTANLAASLTSSAMSSSINNIEDLAKQYKVAYGCGKGGSTQRMFGESKVATYKKIFLNMESRTPSVYTDGNNEGKSRVIKEKGNYAFFMEAAAIEYALVDGDEGCKLRQLGGLLDSKGYGIALPPGSPYTREISDGVVKLIENGKIASLKKKWWKPRKTQQCGQAAVEVSARLGLANLGGVFIFLIGGLLISMLIAVFEFIWNHRKLAVDDNESVFSDMWKELIFSINPNAGETKPIKKEGSSKSASQSLSKSKAESLNKYDVFHNNAARKSDASYACFNEDYGTAEVDGGEGPRLRECFTPNSKF